MRCPHCAGEIPAGSRFCGICGRSIGQTGDGRAPAYAAPGRAPAAELDGQRYEAQVDSVSLFELPASKAGRRAKLALILVLDAILAGAGVVMLLSYLESRRERAAVPAESGPTSMEVKAPGGGHALEEAPAAVQPEPGKTDASGKSEPEEEGERDEADESEEPTSKPAARPKPAVEPKARPSSPSARPGG